MKEFTLEQAIVIMGFTGISTVGFSKFNEDVEKRLGRSVWTHQFPGLKDEIKAAYRDDFIAMCLSDTYDKRPD